MLSINFSEARSPSQIARGAKTRVRYDFVCIERNAQGVCTKWGRKKAAGFGIFGAALPEDEIIKLAQEVAEKASTSGAAVVEVTNIFRLIDDFASQDAVALRASGLVVTAAGKATSIQASLVAARQLTPISPASVTTITTTPAGLSRNTKIGIGVVAAGLLAVGLTFGIRAARARR